jgi:PAS domain S-box-containing protein
MNINIDLLRFFDHTPDLVCIAGKDGYFKNFNQAVLDTLGYTRQELLAQPISNFIHPDDVALTAHKRKALLRGEVLIDFENRYLSKAGSIVWLHWTSVFFVESDVVIAIAKNITRRKLKEISLEERFAKFKSLVSHFKSSLEKDKEELAVELHEELAQIATVLKADLSWLKSNHADAASQDRIEHALSVAELLIRSIRKLSYSISPKMMEDVGFAETIDWLCAEFASQYAISCSHAIFCEEESLPQDVKVDLFRMCQEALYDFVLHSRAKNVTILLEQTGHHISLTISDDGTGYDPETVSDLLAATSLRERADSLHGEFTVESVKNKGTTLSVSFSLEGYHQTLKRNPAPES